MIVEVSDREHGVRLLRLLRHNKYRIENLSAPYNGVDLSGDGDAC